MQTRPGNIIFHLSLALVLLVAVATDMPVKADEMRWEIHQNPSGTKATIYTVVAESDQSAAEQIHESSERLFITGNFEQA